MRPELDASQLFEVMRRSAVDIDAPGRDDATGFGLLNVPAALAYAAPVRDPLEPNDDMDYVTPGKTFDNGIPPLTTKAKPSTTLTGRLATVEDPRDVYRVFVPARGTITVKAGGRGVGARALDAGDADGHGGDSEQQPRCPWGHVEGHRHPHLQEHRCGARRSTWPSHSRPRVRDATYTIAVTAR